MCYFQVSRSTLTRCSGSFSKYVANCWFSSHISKYVQSLRYSLGLDKLLLWGVFLHWRKCFTIWDLPSANETGLDIYRSSRILRSKESSFSRQWNRSSLKASLFFIRMKRGLIAEELERPESGRTTIFGVVQYIMTPQGIGIWFVMRAVETVLYPVHPFSYARLPNLSLMMTTMATWKGKCFRSGLRRNWSPISVNRQLSLWTTPPITLKRYVNILKCVQCYGRRFRSYHWHNTYKSSL